MSMSAKSQPCLSEVVADEIRRSGPMPFSRFMEFALYSVPYGYYAGGGARVGKDGDFYTSVSVGSLFGRLIAGQFLEMHRLLGKPADFTIVEQGANDGRLALDVLTALEGTDLHAVRMIIIEPLQHLRGLQADMLKAQRVAWVASASELTDFSGVHFSNELFDALPFEILQCNGGKWHALHVLENDGQLFFSPGDSAFAGASLPPRPDGFIAEVRPSQDVLIKKISEKLRRGYVLALDYGMSRRELLASHRSDGTFACYMRHKRDSKPLECPGSKDITAHVDFSALARSAVACGFELQGYTDQHHFIVGASTALFAEMEGKHLGMDQAKTLRSLRTLMHPEGMGAQFKALLLSKNAPEEVASGFQFAREAPYLLDEADDFAISPGFD